MVNTNIEGAIHAMDAATLEQLADDLLKREEFEVETTSTHGADNKRDSIIKKDNEIGIVHCSTARDIENKINEDAEKASERPEDFDFFYFFTNTDRATVMRDRLEEEITDQYGFRTRIRDFEYLRNSLMGDKENQDLARRHLDIDPSGIVNSVDKLAESLSNKENISHLEQQLRISIEEWGIVVAEETVALFQPESFEKTQELISVSLSNFGSGNAYNIQSSLCIYWIDDLDKPDIEEIRSAFKTAEPTSNLRQQDQDVGDSPKNHLSPNQSSTYTANTFVWLNGKKRSAFNAAATGPFHPESSPPDGLAVGLKLFYDDELGATTERMVFAGVGPVPRQSLAEFYKNLLGHIPVGSKTPILPTVPNEEETN
jgi:BMFP domain-containing protein YqiC